MKCYGKNPNQQTSSEASIERVSQTHCTVLLDYKRPCSGYSTNHPKSDRKGRSCEGWQQEINNADTYGMAVSAIEPRRSCRNEEMIFQNADRFGQEDSSRGGSRLLPNGTIS
jgi:hypothetical protein